MVTQNPLVFEACHHCHHCHHHSGRGNRMDSSGRTTAARRTRECARRVNGKPVVPAVTVVTLHPPVADLGHPSGPAGLALAIGPYVPHGPQLGSAQS